MGIWGKIGGIKRRSCSEEEDSCSQYLCPESKPDRPYRSYTLGYVIAAM